MDTNSLFQTSSNMPPELSSPLPRSIRTSTNTRYYSEIVPALMLGLIIVLSLFACKSMVHQMQLRSALRRDSAEVLGEITKIKSLPRSRDLVSYTFDVSGIGYFGKASIPNDLDIILHESGKILIQYIPSNPAINHPAAWEWSFEWSGFIGILFLMLFMSMFSVSLVQLYRRRKLLAWGKPAVGIVTGCAPAKGSFSLKYEFSTETGTPVTGSGYSTIFQETGARICVLYLPQNPKRNLSYPVPGYFVEQ